MVHIRRAKEEDLITILDIYNQGIRDRIATLETEEKDLKYMSDWFLQRSDKYAVLTAAIEHEVAGWASLNSYSHRCAYRGVADLSLKGGEGLRPIFVNIQPRNQPAEGRFHCRNGILQSIESLSRIYHPFKDRILASRLCRLINSFVCSAFCDKSSQQPKGCRPNKQIDKLVIETPHILSHFQTMNKCHKCLLRKNGTDDV